MDALKIAVIGGGSTYTPELIDGFVHGQVPVREIALVDIDQQKLQIVGGLAQRMARAAQAPFPITLHGDRTAALDGADVVITQIRVGGMAARIQDEKIPQRYSLIGQETTGPGGFAKALRTIPIILDINREMAERCPNAWLINFTNPSGLVTEALRLYGRGNFVGLCNYPLTLKMKVAETLGIDEARVELAYFGLNHLSWTRVVADGADRTDEVIERMIADPHFRELSGYAFSAERLRSLGLIPSGYLRYYYDADLMVAAQAAATQTRGERVREVETQLLADYADPALCRKPDGLQERGGAWYSTAAVRLVQDLWSDTGGTHVLNVPNGEALASLPSRVVVEAPARVAHGEIHSLPTVAFTDGALRVRQFAIPEGVEHLIGRVKAYELRAAHAAVSGCRQDAIAALEAHPLLDGLHEQIPALVDELLAAHRAHLPQFATPEAA